MRISSLGVLLSTAVVTALGAGGVMPAATADEVSSVSISQSETPDRWFVQLAGKAKVHGASASQVAAEKQAFRDAAKAAGVTFKERFAYDTLWNGFSVQVDGANLAALRSVPGVKAVFPVVLVDGPPRSATDGESSVDLATAVTQTGVDLARSQLGLTGQGIKVAIIDTGIDYDHPDLGGGFGPGYKVAYGYDLVGDGYDAAGSGDALIPQPDDDPDDCAGHGSHVAGIVGAKAASASGVTGVAPDVTLGAYRVFGCAGSSSSDVIIAALERAYADGMQVVNQSLGAAFQWPEYPTAQVSNTLVQAGVVVVASAGNNGATGSWSLGAPGVASDVIGVASFDNTSVTQFAFSISPDDRKIGYGAATGAPPPPTSGTSPMSRTGTQTSAADGCNVLPPGSLAGTVALIRRGTCGFYVKAFNAQTAGAIGVVLYNNQPGVVNPTVAGTPAITIPVVMASAVDGNLIDTRLAAGPVNLTWGAGSASSPSATGNLISSFSSYGLSPDLVLKPDLGAPGGNIWSTYPLELGGYTSLSGTSMSSPHVAGAVALLLEAKPGTKAADVRAMLQNTADPKAWSLNAGLGFLDNVHRQGAGMLDIDDAITSTVGVTPGKLSLGESQAGPQTRTLTIRNTGNAPVTLNLSSVDAITTNRAIPATGTTTAPGPVPFVFNLGASAVSYSQNPVTVAAGGTSTVSVTIGADAALADGTVYGGYIVLTPATGGSPYRVPFAGYKGDYQAIQPLDGFNNNPTFPWLTKLANGTFTNQPNGATYTLANGDLPYFLVHFNHQVRRVEFEVVNAATGRRVHPVFANFEEDDYIGRNSTRQQFFSFAWDGTRMHDNGKGTPDHRKLVPNGQYKVNIRALKALGDPANPAHWQVWTSPVVTIARP